VLKKLLIGLATFGLAGLLIASAGSVGRSGEAVRTGTPTIALVNEDEASTFNGDEYLFGGEFVRLVSNDNRYNWQVVSRGVAEKAYADEAVSAVILLPRSFSRDLLTMQDIDPTRAVVDYRIAAGDQLTEQRLRNAISSILRDFNARVVEMYFASVAGNIANAQAGMAAVVGRYSKLVGTLAGDLQPEVVKTGEGHKQSESLAQLLRSMNSAWIQAQNGFTTATTGTLTSISGSLAARQPELSGYFSLQEQLARTNVLNGNGAIADQAASDKDYYRQAFEEHIAVLRSGDGGWSGFDGLSSVDAGGAPTGALAELQRTVAEYDALASEYAAEIAGFTSSLASQRDALEASSGRLAELATRLFSEYFGIVLTVDGSNYAEIDPSAVSTDALARTALAQKVANTFASSSTNESLTAYEQELAALVSRISTDPAASTRLFGALQSATDFDPAPVASRLELIGRYAAVNDIDGPTLTIVPTAEPATGQTVTKTLPVTVPAGERHQVEIQVPEALSPSDVTVTVASPTGSEPGGVRTTIDQANDIATVDNRQGTGPLTIELAFAVDLHDLAGDARLEYTAKNIDDAGAHADAHSLGSDRYLLVPASPAAGTVAADYQATTSYLADIATAANLLRFLYGAPGESEAAFSSSVLASGEFRDHSADSVHQRYGAVDAATAESLLHDDDVSAYRALGIENLRAVLGQLGTVIATRAAIDEDIERLSRLRLEPSYFTSTLRQLEAWYAAARTSIDAAPALWAEKSNSVIRLSTVPWAGQKPGLSELYLDDETGPALYEALSRLVESSSRNAEAVAAGARLIEDNSARFDDLIAGVQRTQAETDALLGVMDGTIAADNAGVAQSGEFSSRFSTVLANTRANGADPAKIYQAFASPVTVKDTTPAAKAEHGTGFDYRWIAVFVAGSLIGGLVAALVARRNRRPARTRG